MSYFFWLRNKRLRQDLKHFEDLIETPGNLVTGVTLPANGELAVSCNSNITTQVVLDASNGRELGMKDSDADQIRKIGYFEKDLEFTVEPGLPGILSLYVVDRGNFLKIAEG